MMWGVDLNDAQQVTAKARGDRPPTNAHTTSKAYLIHSPR
jgi:hypothetical protein